MPCIILRCRLALYLKSGARACATCGIAICKYVPFPPTWHMICALKHHGIWRHLPLGHIGCLRGFANASNRCSQTNSFNDEEPRVIVSGIQPTGVPHLGNYLGALRPWLRLQNGSSPSTKLFFSIVDLHAITMPQDKDQLRLWKRETLISLLAMGLDPQKCVLFYQSNVSLYPCGISLHYHTGRLDLCC